MFTLLRMKFRIIFKSSNFMIVVFSANVWKKNRTGRIVRISERLNGHWFRTFGRTFGRTKYRTKYSKIHIKHNSIHTCLQDTRCLSENVFEFGIERTLYSVAFDIEVDSCHSGCLVRLNGIEWQTDIVRSMSIRTTPVTSVWYTLLNSFEFDNLVNEIESFTVENKIFTHKNTTIAKWAFKIESENEKATKPKSANVNYFISILNKVWCY